MRNVDWLYQHGKLLEFLYDYCKALDQETDDFKWFENKYGIDPNISTTDWLMTWHKEDRMPVVGSKVRKSYMRSNGETFDIYGTITQIILDDKGEHVYVRWDDIDSFKTMETLGKEVFVV